jgi:hypothetical protein
MKRRPLPRDERRAADLFFASLVGAEVRRRRRRPPPAAPAPPAEDDDALAEGPLSESEWSDVLDMLERGEADALLPFTGDADRNALLVAARLFCDRNAVRLEGGDPLLCVVGAATLRDPRVQAFARHVIERGPIVAWTRVPRPERIRRVMALLVDAHGLPLNGAAGLAGNLHDASAVLPPRVEGSAEETPLRASGFDGRVTDFSAGEVMNRSPSLRAGPRLGGVGIAQWSADDRRAGLFIHAYRGVRLGPRILFDLEAQVDYLMSEMRASFAGVHKALRAPEVTIEAASDQVLLNYEMSGSFFDRLRRKVRTDPHLAKVQARRRALAREAAEIHQSGD